MATDGAGTGSKAQEAIVKAKRDFARAWAEDAASALAALPGEWGAKVKAGLEPRGERGPALWEAANTLGAACNDKPLPNDLREACFGFIARIRDFMGRLARESGATTTVVFGTSGWREAIGEGFTVLNVHKVVRGIIAMMKDPVFLKTNGYADFAQVKSAGILILRDNRFMGDEFMACAMRELAAEGIRIHDAGECPTGVGSAVLTELKAAGSINFTPSHNPMEYAGIKFNPADGGPADVDLTSLIEKHANALMLPGVQFRRAEADFRPLRNRVEAADIFTAFVEKKSKVFDLRALRAWLVAEAPGLFIAVDNMHGSSRGYIQNLLGPQTMGALEASGSIRFYNTEDDFAFHGVKPEPNAKNQAILIAELKKSGRARTLAVALDPDADRIRFADAELDIDMNRFGAIGYANLLKRGIKGGLATTVPSSGFASEIAKKQGMRVSETEVGFKNFRAPLSSGAAVMAFEESDGISFAGHTLEKCALAGFLSALSCLAAGGNLSEQYRELRREYGWFYPGKGGADVKGVSVEAWQRYKGAVMRVLENGMVKAGDKLEVGAARKEVARLNTADGLKIVFTDRSWILLRPSGTEPKFRYYFEVVGESELADAAALSDAYAQAASALLERARESAGPAE